MPAPFRDIQNAPTAIFIPSDLTNWYGEDWAHVTGTLRDALFDANPLALSINGTPRIASGGTATFFDVLPEADLSGHVGLGGTRWLEVHAGTYFGSGAGLTGVPVAGHTHPPSEIVAPGTLAAARGGTNTGVLTIGDLLVASGTSAWSLLPNGIEGYHLIAGATTPNWTAPTESLLGELVVNLTITSKQNIYTVPGSTSATVIRMEFVAPNGTIGPTTAAGLGWDAGASDVIAAMTVKDIDAATQYGLAYPDNPAVVGAAAQVLGLAFSNANTGSATTATVRVIGREF